ncbi:hypothetical protein [Pseudomonas fluorescens]|uniref:hypothetical protein n=1 Tax=Pseudomonas TaxID=286 RepID=UPI003CFCA576
MLLSLLKIKLGRPRHFHASGCQDRNSAADRALNPVVRLHIGLEDVDALTEDLLRGFTAAT